jgi:hypothetical protein
MLLLRLSCKDRPFSATQEVAQMGPSERGIICIFNMFYQNSPINSIRVAKSWQKLDSRLSEPWLNCYPKYTPFVTERTTKKSNWLERSEQR